MTQELEIKRVVGVPVAKYAVFANGQRVTPMYLRWVTANNRLLAFKEAYSMGFRLVKQ